MRISELQLELAGQGRYAELAQLSQQWSEVVRRLPHPTPGGAREWLERALAMDRRVTIELLRRREQVLISLRRVEMSKRAARGYSKSIPAHPSRHVLERA